MTLDLKLPSPLTTLDGAFLHGSSDNQSYAETHNISLLCKRDDLIHPIISGNKWRKLSANLANIQKANYQHIISFGGAYSNHLHALSWACRQLGIKFTAVIRGNYSDNLSPTLLDMQAWGTHLHYVTKLDYKKRSDEAYCQHLLVQLKADFFIPEGGSHFSSLNGMSILLDEIAQQEPDTTHIILPVASGGTLAGLIASKALPHAKLIGIGVLKGKGYLEELVENLLRDANINPNAKTWQILHDFHHNGYAKSSKELRDFVDDFNTLHSDVSVQQKIDERPSFSAIQSLPIESVYSGKCFFALKALLSERYFPPNSKIVIIHTGGLQGARGASPQ